MDGAADAAEDGSIFTPPSCEGIAVGRPEIACTPLETDYVPGSDSDGWDSCIVDSSGDDYPRIEETVSTIARVAGYDRIAARIFTDATPSAADFLAAREIYQEDEGLDSRIVRRYDPRYEAPEGIDCTMAAVAEANPDYCVGPAILQPILLDAFQKGIAGEEPGIQAARIEAALLWFMYASVSKESFTCTTSAKDCDSAWAYYNGGTSRDDGLALAAEIRSVDIAAHNRVFDGILALRCWRDLDFQPEATMLDLRDRARAQLDTALSFGLAQVIRQRILDICDAEGDALAVQWAGLSILLRALKATAEAGDASAAQVIAEAAAQANPGDVDMTALVSAIDTVYTCP